MVLSYSLAAFSAVLSAFYYAELAVALHIAGGAFTYVGLVFGDFVAWVAATNFLMEYTLAAAAVARACSSYASTLFGLDPTAMRISMGSVKQFELNIFACGAVILLSLLLMHGTRTGTQFNIIVTLVRRDRGWRLAVYRVRRQPAGVLQSDSLRVCCCGKTLTINLDARSI